MKYFFLFLLMFLLEITYSQCTNCIQVIDENKQPLAKAIIFYNNQQYETNKNGIVEFSNFEFPAVVYVYKTKYEGNTIQIEETAEFPIIIQLKEHLHEIEQVVVKADEFTTDETSVTEQISTEEIIQSTAVNVADLLEKEEGVSIAKMGATVSKPILHGLQGKRLPVLDNGSVISNQNWSDHHGLEVDVSTAAKIKIIKGANSLRYGNGALGGSILIEQKALKSYNQSLEGRVKTTAYTNGRGIVSALNLGGRIKETNFTWQGQGSYKRFGTYKTPDVYLINTANQQHSYRFGFGYDTEKTAIETTYASYSQNIGVFTGSRIANKDDLFRLIELGRPVTIGDFSYDIQQPNHKVNHQIGQIKAEHKLMPELTAKAQYAYQQNKAKEYEIRRGNSSTPVNNLQLTTNQYNGAVEYQKDIATLELGAKYSTQDNENISGTGVVPVLPNYYQQQMGAYAIAQITKENYVVESGLRYDNIESTSKGLDFFGQEYGGKRTFDAFSYQLGGSYNFTNELSASLHSGYSWRAPNPHELYAQGLDHGTAIYQTGNANLNAEKGLKTIASLQYENTLGTLKATGFHHSINDYIYSKYTDETILRFSGVFPVFETIQNNATLTGLDISLETERFNNFQLSTNFSTMKGELKEQDVYLPQMPPNQFYTTLNYQLLVNKFVKSVEVAHQYSAKQTRYSTENEFLPNPPNAYHLFEIQTFGEISFNKTNTMLNWKLGAENVFNTNYALYTDKFRYFANQKGRNIYASFWVEF